MNRFVSVHIPKSAGTTWLKILAGIYGDRFCHDNRDVPHDGAFHYPPMVERYHVIHGHFRAEKYRHLGWPVVTWLRHPIDRIVSQYEFQRTRPAKRRDVHTTCLVRARLSLVEFAQLKANAMTEVYLRGLAPEDLAFVGFQDRFDADLRRFGAQAGVAIPASYRSYKVRWRRADIRRVDLQAVARIMRRDIQFYRDARRRADGREA